MSCKMQPWNRIRGIRRGAAGTALVLAITLVPAVVATQSAQAQSFSFTPLHSFTGSNTTGTGVSDGSTPYGGLALDANGNLYGTTTVGGSLPSGTSTACRPVRGAAGCGTVFQLSPPPAGSSSGTPWTENVLYSFTSDSTLNSNTGLTCFDGAFPYGGVTLDTYGDIFGTTYQGGVEGEGTVFEVSLNPPVLNNNPCYSSNSNPAWTEVPLTTFDGDVNGANPQGGLTMDSHGNLYGTNYNSVFEVDQSGRFTTLYNFSLNAYDSEGNTNGTNPGAGLALVENSLYGTTLNGGNSGLGTAFQLAPSTDPLTSYYTETGIIQFGSGDQYGITDGALPLSGISGKTTTALYGTTFEGGAYGYGTVYETDQFGDETVLYSFTGGADGGGPIGGVVKGTKGTLYGTTSGGGANGLGTVFVVYPVSVANDEYNEAVLYSFTGGADGAGPTAGLVQDAKGNLYGTANYGGVLTGQCKSIGGCGTVFEMAYSSTTPTSSKLVSSSSSTTYGQSATFTSTVSALGSAYVPKGSVTFTMNGTVTLKTTGLKDGVATYTTKTTGLVAGADTITATYNPTGAFLTSSATVNQTVAQASTTITSLTWVNSIAGGDVTFTAVVAPEFGGKPTGTVTFYDSATSAVLATATLSTSDHAKVSVLTSTLPVGTYNITATYTGDSNFTGSTLTSSDTLTVN